MSDEDRTLPATDRRRQQARDDGQVPMSREVVAASGLVACTLLLMMAGPAIFSSLSNRLANMLIAATREPDQALGSAGLALIMAVLPIAGVVALGSVAAVMLQTGWLINTKALIPDLTRLNPGSGLKRVFSTNNAVEAGKAAVKMCVVGLAVWHVLSRTLPTTARASSWTLSNLLNHLAQDVLQILLVVVGLQIAIALFDVIWVRYRFAQRLRMSIQEVKQEHKEQEGDPRLKSKLKQIRSARARRRMVAAVAKATVVVTNPTHYAVALAYERGSKSAPKIVAKGVDEIAARIREAAERHRVPLFPNPPLARALHGLPLDSEVPPEHFKAVAEIIAWIWRVRQGARPVT